MLGKRLRAHVSVFLVFSLVLALPSPITAHKKSFPDSIEKGPWTSITNEGMVTISFELLHPMSGEVLYGPLLGEPKRFVSFNAEQALHHISLSGLRPGTTYTYKIVLENGDQTPLGRFGTPPEHFVPFTFLVYGDTRTFYGRHTVVAERMAKDAAAFVVHTGDLVESPTRTDWAAFFSSGRSLLLSKLFFPVLGNHERNHFSYYRLFQLPGAGGKKGKQWWSFRWGDVLFVGLDSNTQYLGFTGLREETRWLKETLSQEARFKFVFFHHPLFSSDPHYGGNEGLAALWHPVFVRNAVTAVFCGHVHAYEHIVRDGIHYFTTGGGGAPMYSLGEPVEGTVYAAAGLLHYLRVSVEEDAVQVEMVPVAEVPLGEEEGEIKELDGEPLEIFRIETGVPAGVP